MKISLYGLPCAGKTTLLQHLTNANPNAKIINGSKELNRLAGGRFSELPDSGKDTIRQEYARQLAAMDDPLILSDGHYSFLADVVFTPADGDAYDVFFYLYCPPDILLPRIQTSEKNQRFASLSPATIEAWQDFEIEQLRRECHARNKDFYVLNGPISFEDFSGFIAALQAGFGSFELAEDIVCQIRRLFPSPCPLVVVDGDKTLIEQDSSAVCSHNHRVDMFEGDFYTGYQSFVFAKEAKTIEYDLSMVSELTLNPDVFGQIEQLNYVVLSAGPDIVWQEVGRKFGIKNIFASQGGRHLDADVKYFVVKLLRQAGYIITAYGDSKTDFYMLKEADAGYLVAKNKLSGSLRKMALSGLKLMYSKEPVILAESGAPDVLKDISICKSDSGINGNALAAAHLRLGQKLGEAASKLIPSKNTAVIVLDRGGRFFGDGFYASFGGVFYPMNPKKDPLPAIRSDCVVIVDSVVNSGKSVLELTRMIRDANPMAEVFVAANVVQNKALEKLNDVKVFAVRVSENSFVGRNQAAQAGCYGPDTADRLYNLIQAPF